MLAHLTEIAAREEARIAADALALIVRAAEGSVRDALSLLDQAIAHGGSETTADQVRAMLGLPIGAGCSTCSTGSCAAMRPARWPRRPGNMPTGPTRRRCSTIWPRSPIG
jgi:hypothetical protein